LFALSQNLFIEEIVRFSREQKQCEVERKVILQLSLLGSWNMDPPPKTIHQIGHQKPADCQWHQRSRSGGSGGELQIFRIANKTHIIIPPEMLLKVKMKDLKFRISKKGIIY